MLLLPYVYDNVANESTDVVLIFLLPSMKLYEIPKNFSILACVCWSRQKRVNAVGFSIRQTGMLQLTPIHIQLYWSELFLIR